MIKLGAAILAVLASTAFSSLHAQQDTARVRRSMTGEATELGVFLDRPVDRAEYRLGPGDLLQISVFGELNTSHELPVTPEGAILIPGMGVAAVGGHSLDAAELEVRRLAARYYRNVEVKLSLLQVRRFRVYVAGQVPNPGGRIASAVTRVSELLGADRNGELERRYRNIVIRRADGDSIRADLVRFRLTGDLRANPVVSDGDVILVPPMGDRVHVLGRVFFPGEYEFVPGETLAELLRIANGGTRMASDAADSIRIARGVTPENTETIVVSQQDALGAFGARFRLLPFDVVSVPEMGDYARSRMVEVVGEVVRPGSYPIEPGVTTVRELVRLAGGLLSSAAVSSATLHRCGATADPLAGMREVPAELLSSHDRRLLLAASGVHSRGCKLVTDFASLFSDRGSLDHPLQPGDLLSIPRRATEVTVMGAVRRPGAIPHANGLGTREYVRLAGGFARGADVSGAVVFKAGSGDRLDARDVEKLDPGDMLVVPFSERRDYYRILSTASTVVATITTIVLTWVAVGR
jgi:polysaccharide biosynthesis/export protein